MKLGYIGLGKMGRNMAERLYEKGYEVVAFDTNEEARASISHVAATSDSIQDLVASLSPPRLIWMMVPHAVVDSVTGELAPLLDRGDMLIDGGNSFYKDSMKRAERLSAKGIRFLDVGVSGGPAGARNGACLMVGGERGDFDACAKLFADLSADGGFGYMGKHGAGHFVKMVHNGIEYGMMQAIAEGFGIMKKSKFNLDVEKIAEVYSHGSVIESRLIGWLKDAFEQFGPDLEKVSGSVSHTGEGEWTIQAAEELGIPVPIMKGAFDFRVASKENPSFVGKILSALRNQFGGHRAHE